MKLTAAIAAAVLVSATTANASPQLTLSSSLLPSPTMVLGLTAQDGANTPAATARTTVFGLPRNVGTVDRIIRGVIAAALIGLGTYRAATDAPLPGWTVAAFVGSAIPALTAITGYCPLYHAFGWDTN